MDSLGFAILSCCVVGIADLEGVGFCFLPFFFSGLGFLGGNVGELPIFGGFDLGVDVCEFFLCDGCSFVLISESVAVESAFDSV